MELMDFIYLSILASIVILLVYIFLIRNNLNKVNKINLNRIYKKHYTLKTKSGDIETPEIKAVFNSFSELNSELFKALCYLLDEINILRDERTKYFDEIRKIKDEIDKIKTELIMSKDKNLQLMKEINELKTA